MFSRRISAEITMAAPPARVWAALMDFPAHAAWNPFIRGIAGEAALGEELTVILSPGGVRSYVIRPRVTRLVAEQRLAWRSRLFLPGLFTGAHDLALTAHAGGTRFTHTAGFSGILLPMLRGMLAETEQGLARMNTALRQRVEA